MEIGDIFVVNKADMPGAEAAARTLGNALTAAYVGDPGVNVSDAPRAAAVASANLSPGLAALRRRHGDTTTDASAWVPPGLELVAADNRGVAELCATIDLFVGWSEKTGRRAERGRERAYAQILRALTAQLLAPYVRLPGAERWPAAIGIWVDKIAGGQASPVEAAEALLKDTTNKRQC